MANVRVILSLKVLVTLFFLSLNPLVTKIAMALVNHALTLTPPYIYIERVFTLWHTLAI